MILEQELGIVAMEPMGEYDNTVKYEKLNIVTYNGSTYCALGDTLGNEPTNKEYWQLIAKEGDKGDTYELTDEDKENIKNEITENANSDFNKNVESKTNTFNDNVIEKTSSFNTNVENKTKEFNNNSTTKLEKFNTNSTNKLEEYNTNSTTKINSYNTNATAKLEEYNTNANARLNEYNSNADGLMTIAVDTRNELERVKNDVLETGEASGSYLTLNDSAMAQIQELEINSAEKQFTTTGKNQANTKITKWEYLGVTVEYEEKTQILTINGTATGDSALNFKSYNFSNINLASGERLNLVTKYISGSSSASNGRILLTDENYTLSMSIPLSEINSDIVVYKISSVDLIYNNLQFGYKAGDVFNNLKIKLMISKGNDTSYEPYTGLNASPSPDYPQEIPMITTDSVLKSVGKNSFDKDNPNILKNVYFSDNKIISSSTSDVRTLYIPCLPNATYTIAKIISSRFRITTTENTPAIGITGINYIANDSAKILSFTTASNARYLCIYYYSGNTDTLTEQEILDSIQIEEGSTATEYEPYQETILNMPIPEGEFVGYINDNAKDTFRVGYNEEDGNYHLYLDKMLGKVVLDGNEEIKLGGVYENITQFDYIMSNQVLYINDNIARCISNHFVSTHFNNSLTRDNTVTLTGNSIRFMSSTFTTVEEFKNWLATNNVEVVYALAEPYTLDLGIVDMPLSYDGTTNIFVDTDILTNINTKYYRNFTETIRNLQINNSTLKNELVSVESRLSALEAAIANMANVEPVEEVSE